jgi:hypothetical protein
MGRPSLPNLLSRGLVIGLSKFDARGETPYALPIFSEGADSSTIFKQMQRSKSNKLFEIMSIPKSGPGLGSGWSNDLPPA